MWIDLNSVRVKSTKKTKYYILMCIHGISKNATDEPIVRAGIEKENTYVDMRVGGMNWESHVRILPCLK